MRVCSDATAIAIKEEFDERVERWKNDFLEEKKLKIRNSVTDATFFGQQTRPFTLISSSPFAKRSPNN